MEAASTRRTDQPEVVQGERTSVRRRVWTQTRRFWEVMVGGGGFGCGILAESSEGDFWGWGIV